MIGGRSLYFFLFSLLTFRIVVPLVSLLCQARPLISLTELGLHTIDTGGY